MTTLSNDHKKHYRTLGHALKPIVTIAGKGLSENVLAEVDRALEDHELIKVKISIEDKTLRKQCATEMCTKTRATLVQEIGKVALLLRKAKKPDPKKSNLSV